jgi:hypothetical protein
LFVIFLNVARLAQAAEREQKRIISAAIAKKEKDRVSLFKSIDRSTFSAAAKAAAAPPKPLPPKPAPVPRYVYFCISGIVNACRSFNFA